MNITDAILSIAAVITIAMAMFQAVEAYAEWSIGKTLNGEPYSALSAVILVVYLLSAFTVAGYVLWGRN